MAKLSGSELVNEYRAAGYSGIVITDHYFSLFFEWFRDELCLSDHKGIIERYLRGYYSALEEGEKTGFTVLPGAEVRFDNTVNDYLVFGLEARDFFEMPLLNSLKDVNELIGVLPEYALVVQAHPFRKNMMVCDPKPLFGIEVYNGGTSDFRNKMAKMYAEHYGKAMTSGSDVHSEKALAKGGIATDHSIKSSADLVRVLHSGEYSLIETNRQRNF